MPQVPSLLDMFRNGKDAQSKGSKTADAKRAAVGQGSGNALLPLDPAGGKSGIAAPRAFHERVKESRDKLSAKAHRFFPQAKDSKPDAAMPAKAAIDRRDRPERADAPRSEAPEKAEETGRARNNSRETDSRESKPVENRARDEARTDRSEPKDGCASVKSGNGDSESPSREIRAAESPELGRKSVAPDEAELAALKEGLESLGIVADEEQLNDPAFLAEMLLLLQAQTAPKAVETQDLTENGTVAEAPLPLPGKMETAEADLGDGMAMATPEKPDAAPTDPAGKYMLETGEKGAVANAGGNAMDTRVFTEKEAPAAEADSDQASARTTAADTLSRKEIAALIRDRIAELTGNPTDEAGAASARPAKLPATTPSEWHGVEVRPHRETAGLESVPAADLDRMRVLQAAIFQTQATGKELSSGPSMEGAAQSLEAPDEMEEAAILRIPEESGAADGEPEERGFSEGKQGHAGNAEANPRKEGTALLQKDSALGQHFHNALEQARPVEQRESVQRAWTPHQPAFEKSVLDQIAGKMPGLVLKSGEELSIQLAPENLGKVRVSLELKEGVMAARIGVENESVRQIVEANIAGLRESLENQGIKLQGLEVSVDQRQGSLFNPDGSNAESFFQRRGRGADQGAGGAGEPAFETAPESDTGRRLGYNTLEYIG